MTPRPDDKLPDYHAIAAMFPLGAHVGAKTLKAVHEYLLANPDKLAALGLVNKERFDAVVKKLKLCVAGHRHARERLKTARNQTQGAIERLNALNDVFSENQKNYEKAKQLEAANAELREKLDICTSATAIEQILNQNAELQKNIEVLADKNNELLDSQRGQIIKLDKENAELREKGREAIGLLEVAKCPNCDGSGIIPIQTKQEYRVSRDMASDAGDASLEGSLYQQEEWEPSPCEWCEKRKALLAAEAFLERTKEVGR